MKIDTNNYFDILLDMIVLSSVLNTENINLSHELKKKMVRNYNRFFTESKDEIDQDILDLLNALESENNTYILENIKVLICQISALLKVDLFRLS